MENIGFRLLRYVNVAAVVLAVTALAVAAILLTPFIRKVNWVYLS
ncbi:MAG: hypothetical protein Q8O47_01980 [Candidatus Bathyarchaeota archaeon]|nr:hypothetical protein [Candidatus Bathyarchaeota archaeon]